MAQTRGEMLEAIDKADAAWWSNYQREKNSQSVNDTIKHIEGAGREGARQDGHAPAHSPRVSYIYKCRNCGSSLPKGCPSADHEYVSGLTGKIVREAPFDCESCGVSPWQRGEPVGLVVGTTFSPYYDISEGRNAKCPPGVFYAGPGVGHYIPNRQALHDFARMNGKEVR